MLPDAAGSLQEETVFQRLCVAKGFRPTYVPTHLLRSQYIAIETVNEDVEELDLD